MFPLVFKSLHWIRKRIAEIMTLHSSQNVNSELIRHRFNKMYRRNVHLTSLTCGRGLHCAAAGVTILNHDVCAPVRLGGVAGGDQTEMEHSGEPKHSLNPLPEAVIQQLWSHLQGCFLALTMTEQKPA